jgi:hypothetical protein
MVQHPDHTIRIGRDHDHRSSQMESTELCPLGTQNARLFSQGTSSEPFSGRFWRAPDSGAHQHKLAFFDPRLELARSANRLDSMEPTRALLQWSAGQAERPSTGLASSSQPLPEAETLPPPAE